jgi:hypothetical protein
MEEKLILRGIFLPVHDAVSVRVVMARRHDTIFLGSG